MPPFADGSRNRFALGHLLLALPVKNGKFRLLFGGLVEEEFALQRHQRRRRIGRRHEIRQWIAIGQFRLQPRHVELSGHEIDFVMFPFRLVHGRIEFDQGLAGLDHLSVANMDGPHDAGLEWLDDLGTPARNDLAFAEATMSTRPKQAQASAMQNRPTRE